MADAGPETVLPQLSGCFDVSYRFVEDGAHDFSIPATREWIEPRAVHTAEASFSFQRTGIHEGSRFKHWSEDWKKDGSQWVQVVYSPSDSKRFECPGTFSMNQFRCAAKGTPKPTRDTEREDYDKVDREIFVQITPKGYVQSEVNVKVKADGTHVATELGWIEYTRIDSQQCATP